MAAITSNSLKMAPYSTSNCRLPVYYGWIIIDRGVVGVDSVSFMGQARVLTCVDELVVELLDDGRGYHLTVKPAAKL